jgi:prepilin-type N-terminal cleavage/methylation domain-containing protein
MMHPLKRPGRGRGMTLVELLVALAITAIISVAVVSMLYAGGQVNSVLNTAMTNEWEVESALLRMAQQLRQCTTFSVPTGMSGGTAFSLVTQPDAANGNQTYNVNYSLVAGPNGAQQLQKNDSRYGNSILISNLQSFDVRYKTASAPYVVVLTLTSTGSPPVTRLLRVTPRNQ